MSYVGKNIKRIRSVRKLSQADFAKLFNLARPSVGAYEEGRSEPKIQTLPDIAQKFGLSTDLLLTKELTANDLYKLDRVNEKFDQVHSGKTASNLLVIALVRANRFPEYVANHQKKDFINALPPADLPVTFKGEARAFEVHGGEMDYNHRGLHPGDLLLCKRVEESAASSPITGHLYVLVTKDQVIIRRLKSTRNGPGFDLEQELQEIWEVKGVYSTCLHPPEPIDEKVMLLEKAVADLSGRLARLEGGVNLS